MQIPSLGFLEPRCLGIIGIVPLCTALLVALLRYASGSVWSRRPIWLRRFAAEKDELPALGDDDEETVSEHGSTRAPKAWTAWSLALFVLNSTAALLAGVSIIIWPEYSQPSLFYSLPSVSDPLPPSNSAR